MQITYISLTKSFSTLKDQTQRRQDLHNLVHELFD